MQVNNPNIKEITGSVETDRDGNLVRVLKVKTDVVLDPTDPGYDAQKEVGVISAVTAAMGDVYNRADISHI